MSWSATRNSNGTFHVVKDDMTHFEAETEDEIHEVIAELERREQEAKAAAEAAVPDDSVTVNTGDVVSTTRSN